MDDLKLFARNDNELEGLLATPKEFSNDIGMTFGLEKCAKISFRRGSIQKTTDIKIDVNTTIRRLEPRETYKYLGFSEGNGINHSVMKEKIRKEYYRRIRLILKTELSSKNRIAAITALAIPFVQYSYIIIDWNLLDLQQLDQKTRKLLTSHHMHRPKADVDRLYLRRKNGGRGMIQLEMAYRTTTIAMSTYLSSTTDWMLKLVHQHQQNKKLHSIIKEARKYESDLDLNIENSPNSDLPATKQVKHVKGAAKTSGLKQLDDKWNQKPLHGKYYLRCQQAEVDQAATHQ